MVAARRVVGGDQRARVAHVDVVGQPDRLEPGEPAVQRQRGRGERGGDQEYAGDEAEREIG